MGISFNPISGTFDLTGPASGAATWTSTTATEAGLSTTGNTDGDVKVTLNTDYIWVWDGTSSRWVSVGVKSANIGAVPNASGYSLTDTNVGSNRTERTLVLQPADATYGGVVSTTTQSFAGNKTFSGIIFGDAGLDVTAVGASDTLALGTGNADIINIGRSGAIVNIIGTTNYQQVTDLLVSDKLITINDGGAAGSASGTGLEIEENALITGYVKTSGDRNSWTLLAPNTAGIVTITPGAGGFTINQGSHDALTLASVGSTPAAAGASLSGQQLTLQPADGTNPGVVSTTTQTFAGTKTFSSAPVLSSLTASLPLKLDVSNNVLSQAIALGGSEVSGTLTIGNGGTNSAAALNNNRVMQSSSGAIVEAAAITASRALVSDTNGIPTHSATTNTELGYVSGVTSAIQTQLDAKVIKSAGDISETPFVAADNQAIATDVTGLTFANATVRAFTTIVSIVRGATYQQLILDGIQKGAAWELSQSTTGDDCGLTFTITTAGQIQYTSTSTGNTATVKFRAFTLSV